MTNTTTHLLRFTTPVAMAACLGAAAFAQAPKANDLLSHEWRVRNATALQLIKHPDTRNEDLLRVLDTPWQGHVPGYGLGGGGMFRSSDPRHQTLQSAGKKIGYDWPIRAPRHPQSIKELFGPWHPHKLATLVMLQRASATGLQALQPTDTNRARIWITCRKPSEAQIAKALANTTTAGPALFAVLPTVNDQKDLLRKLIADGPAPARRAALRMAGDMPLAAAELRGAIEQLLNDNDDGYARNAAHHLVKSGAPASALLKAHLGTERTERQHILALLCSMHEGAKPAAEELLACLQYDRTSQRRALVALSNFAMPESLLQQAASEIFALLSTTSSSSVRMLAADAIARCGQGVSTEQRTRLQAMLQETKFRSTQSRLLGALRQLDAVPDLELEVLAKIARSKNSTDDSWTALADYGEAAGPMIIKHRLLSSDVGDRLAETAPNMLLGWLNHEQADLQELALSSLLSKRPDLVTSKQLAAMLTEPSDLAKLAFDSLCQRPEASDYAPQLLQFAGKLDWLSGTRSKQIRTLKPTLDMLVETFQPQLCLGSRWSVVRGLGDDQLRVLARQWLKETDDDRVRDRLLAEIIKMGLTKGQDILAVERALGNLERDDILDALSDARKVPAQLIPALEAICDSEQQSESPMDEWNARESLIRAHR